MARLRRLRPLRWLRRTAWVLALLGLLAAVAGAYVYRLARQAEPQYNGEVVLPGLAAPVTVRYGPHAIPYLQAASQADLFFAQGYVTAAERMWQMDLMRRLARGRLAELFGAKALPVDRMFRAMGLEAAARASYAALDGGVRSYLDAYTRGVNAYRAKARDRRPLEYRLIGAEPAAWEPVDSLAIGEYMAFSLSFNAKEELTFLKLARRLGTERARELFPTDEGVPAPEVAPALAQLLPRLGGRLELSLTLASQWGLPVPGPASNSWVLSGRRTASGGPILANDPHLAPGMPGIWYEQELQAPGYHAVGVSLPGVPFIAIGHNADLAWGVTTAMADTQDIYIERPSADGKSVQRPGGETDTIVEHSELLAVRGRAEPERLRVRRTSNGLVLNDLLQAPAGTPLDFPVMDSDYLLCLRWSIELPEQGIEGFYRINTATTPAELRAGVAFVHHVGLSFMYAHRDGTIGWKVSGALPRRSRGTGTFPVPGWTGDYRWEGYVPAAQNPGSKQAGPVGYLLTANNRTVPVDSPVLVGRSWMAPYRAQRIAELLAAKPRYTAQDVAAMQLDRLAIEARHYRDALLRLQVPMRALDPEAWALVERYFRHWDGRCAAGSESAALFVLLRPALVAALYGDELGSDLKALMAISNLAYNATQEVVRSGQSSFWDDVRTPHVETPAQIWARALHAAQAQLAAYGQVDEGPRLGTLRRLVFIHAFHRLPVLGALFDVGPIGVGGDDHTVSVMKAALGDPTRPLYVPSYRVVMTPDDWHHCRGTDTLGQSGHRFSPYRTDQLGDWLSGGTHRWPWGGYAGAEIWGRLRLLPGESR